MKKLIPSWLIIFLVAVLSFISLLMYSSREVNSANVGAEVFKGDASDFKDLELSVCLYAGDNALYEVSIPCNNVQESSGKYKNYEWKKNLYNTEPNSSHVDIMSFGRFNRFTQETINTHNLPLAFVFFNNKTWLEEGKDLDLNHFTNVEFPYLTTDDPEYYLEKDEDTAQGDDSNNSDRIDTFQQLCMCVEINGKEYFTINNAGFNGPYEGKSGIFEVLSPKDDNTNSYDSYIRLLYEMPISSESSRKVLQLVSWEQDNTLGIVYIENERDLMLDVYSLDDNKVIASGKLTTLDTPYENIIADEGAFNAYTNSHYLSVIYKEEVQVFDYYEYGEGEPIAVGSFKSCKELIPELAYLSYPIEVFFDDNDIYFISGYIDDKNEKLSDTVLCLIRQDNGRNIACMKYRITVPFYKIDRKNAIFCSSYIMDCQIKNGGINVRN